MIEVKADVHVIAGDLTAELYDQVKRAGRVAWDIETSGLDWSASKIGTCQLAFGGEVVIAMLHGGEQPKYLAALLEDEGVEKVFHHAPFDLRFMAHQWNVWPAHVACTKIASKILDPGLEGGEHSLKPVLRRHLGLEISKDQQVSDWLAPELTVDQVRYAATDVLHLLELLDVLRKQVSERGWDHELEASYRYLPTRVALDLRGSGDVFAY